MKVRPATSALRHGRNLQCEAAVMNLFQWTKVWESYTQYLW